MCGAMYYIRKCQIITKMNYEENKLIFRGLGGCTRAHPILLQPLKIDKNFHFRE